MVVTASRREETLLNAPATMTVVTAEAIRDAPSRDIVDLLRAVPGMNVVGTSARDFNVTARSSSGTLADSTLVLLDGRSLYQDFFGFVLWDFVPVTVNEFKQIEVIRGPASAVWGANAMNGVINVISRTPREMIGTHVDLEFGQFNRTLEGQAFDGGGLFSINVSHAQAPSDRFAFKVSGSVFTQEAFARPVEMLPGTRIPPPPFENQGTLQPKLDARADYDMADGRQSITLAGGISGTEGIIHSGLGPFEIPRGSTFKYGRINYQRDRLKVQFFVNAVDGHTLGKLVYGIDGQPLVFDFENQAYDVEVSNLHLLGDRHLVSYGGNYRHNNFDLSLASGSGSRDEGGVYVQDQIFLSEQFRWVVGTRIDRFDVLNKNVFSPRTTFMIKPRPSQTIRLSYNRAFRAPSFVDNYMDVDLLGEVTLPTGPFRFPVEAFGDRQLARRRPHRLRSGLHRAVRAHHRWRSAVSDRHAEHDSVCAGGELHQRAILRRVGRCRPSCSMCSPPPAADCRPATLTSTTPASWTRASSCRWRHSVTPALAIFATTRGRPSRSPTGSTRTN